MLRNLELTKGLIYAENIAMAFTTKMDRREAHILRENYCHEAKRKEHSCKGIAPIKSFHPGTFHHGRVTAVI